ncbi:OmpA family protein [Sphingobacterium sp. DK4209]|uniref:OmpA family protein n=1 Tax=Sphingobacterium zhuxiongii TaxID=2662364 RepID=A0A5Q0Q719_9SPHI|nr:MULTISPECIES: OmpA family protein [unclassified Sphingobacterium]MVZ67515.1 OmpA family protein [Sphingobacterium sp. DK4209]QGA24899.1 OmpA family protein [Sphingobacterium sp. dk4302]
MKNYITSIILLCFVLAFAQDNHAQILKKLEKKIEQKVNQRINRKTDKIIDKGLDKVEEGIDGKMGKSEKASPQNNQSSKQIDPNDYIISKFDFISGDKVLFVDAFDQEEKGDFPLDWNTNGSGEIVTIHNLKGNWLKIPDNAISFPELNTTLPQNFTVEFDLFYPDGTTRPPITFGFSEVVNPAKTSIQHKKIFYFHIPPTIKDNVGYSTSLYSGREITQSWPANKMAGKVIRISIAVNSSRIRLYIDARKIFDLPKAFDANELRNNFHFRAAPLIPKPQDGFYLRNLRIAESGLDARSQFVNSGKYSTTGILFEVGSANIMPHSFGILKDMADILIEKPDMMLKIIGHTDNDGGTQLNMELSRKRAAAVKMILEKEFGINANRLSIDGKGSSEPFSRIASPEAKAKNRRVEFIKL